MNNKAHQTKSWKWLHIKMLTVSTDYVNNTDFLCEKQGTPNLIILLEGKIVIFLFPPQNWERIANFSLTNSCSAQNWKYYLYYEEGIICISSRLLMSMTLKSWKTRKETTVSYSDRDRDRDWRKPFTVFLPESLVDYVKLLFSGQWRYFIDR